MSKIIKSAWTEHSIIYTHEFGDENGGFSFRCDEKGNLLPDLCKEAVVNFVRCKNGEIEYMGKPITYLGICKNEREIRHRALIECDCGTRFELSNTYMGACECPECGQWYNLFGQKLNNPRYWED